jgi:hypothetical protein
MSSICSIPEYACPSNRASKRSSLFRTLKAGLYTILVGYEQQFEDQEEPTDPDLKFRVSLADSAASRLTDTIYQEVATLLMSANVPTLEVTQASRILDDYRIIVPAIQTTSLTNILNAAWDVFNNPNFWPNITDPAQKLRVIRDLILKNIELLEIEQRVPS